MTLTQCTSDLPGRARDWSDRNIGLLVIGGPRRDVPDAFGLVARTALRHAGCPVLIVPR